MTRLEKQLKDFVQGGLDLFWQRQAMFAGATLLSGYFLSIQIALFSYLLCEMAEAFDLYISKRVMKWHDGDAKTASHLQNLLTVSSTFSALTVAQYVILVARQEGPQVHFAPLFFLFSAALFAAMNNHQLPRVLVLRLIVYGAAFLYIPAWDLMVVRPPFDSRLWMQFATVLFVLYFIIDCSRIFLRFYKNGLKQIDDLRTERDRVTAAYEVQTQFVSIVSHELRTPLTSIKGALGLISSGALGTLPNKMEHIADIARKNTDRLALLINDLLDMQKLEAGKMCFNLARINLATVVADAIDANRDYGALHDISLVAHGLDKTLFINADYDRLMQVMANVVSNAVKFSPKGGTVDISLEQAGAKAHILVKDKGTGIPENSEDKVFGKFMQVDASDQREIGGTGLGMSITRQLLEGQGGHIHYHSMLGKGTTFIIEFNMLEADQEVLATPQSGRPSGNNPLQTFAAE